MSIVTTLNEKGTQNSGADIWYMDNRYLETTNQRDFGFEMFWTSIVSFVGLFMGFSLLQVPDLVENSILKMTKTTKNKRSSK